MSTRRFNPHPGLHSVHAFCPAALRDITGYGKTEEEATANWHLQAAAYDLVASRQPVTGRIALTSVSSPVECSWQGSKHGRLAPKPCEHLWIESKITIYLNPKRVSDAELLEAQRNGFEGWRSTVVTVFKCAHCQETRWEPELESAMDSAFGLKAKRAGGIR